MEHLNKKIREKLQGQRIEINTDELWKEVYPHIKPEKNRRPFLFLMFGLFWVVSVVGVGWYFNSYDNVSEVTQAKLDNNNKTEIVDSDRIKKSSLENQIVPASVNKLVNPESSQKFVEAEKTNLSQVSFGLNEDTFSKNTNTKMPPSVNRSNEEMLVQLVKNNTPIQKTDTQQSNYISKISAANEINTETTVAGLDSQEEVKELRKYAPNLLLENTIKPIEYSYPQPYISNELSAYDYDSDYSKFSVYALGGMYAVNRSLTANGLDTSPNLVSRSASESPLESIAAEFGFNYRFTDNLMLSAGLNYTRINEKVQDTYAVTDTVLLENVIIEYITSSRGSEPVYGNIMAERTVNTSLTAFNKYTDISLSLDLTYFLNKNKFSPYFSLGVLQSIRSMQSGFWLLDGNTLYNLSDDNNAYLSNQYGLAIRAGVGGQLNISDRSSVVAGARYMQYLNPITNQNYELKQRYNLLGLHAGFSVKI